MLALARRSPCPGDSPAAPIRDGTDNPRRPQGRVPADRSALPDRFRCGVVAASGVRYTVTHRVAAGRVADVIAAVNFARDNNLLVAVRGGGHNAAGHATCDDGIVIDLTPMKGIRVDPAGRTAQVQGGATWIELDRETQAFGLATTGGTV